MVERFKRYIVLLIFLRIKIIYTFLVVYTAFKMNYLNVKHNEDLHNIQRCQI